jgi:hypothetical protein
LKWRGREREIRIFDLEVCSLREAGSVSFPFTIITSPYSLLGLRAKALLLLLTTVIIIIFLLEGFLGFKI